MTDFLDKFLNEKVLVRKYNHPDWGGLFYLETSCYDLEILEDYAGPFDKDLLTYTEVYMTRRDLHDLPEWEG